MNLATAMLKIVNNIDEPLTVTTEEGVTVEYDGKTVRMYSEGELRKLSLGPLKPMLDQEPLG